MDRKVILYMTVSLDGYIADEDGTIDWQQKWMDDEHEAFLKRIDTVLMGRKTYDQIMEASPLEWPYQKLKSYIFTHQEMEDRRGIAFVQKRLKKCVKELKEQAGKDIWLCGGSNLANQMMTEGLIDEYHLRLMPIILGGGIPLFCGAHPELKLQVKSVEETEGVIDIVYIDYRHQSCNRSLKF